jgi:hypothetical protein
MTDTHRTLQLRYWSASDRAAEAWAEWRTARDAWQAAHGPDRAWARRYARTQLRLAGLACDVATARFNELVREQRA